MFMTVLLGGVVMPFASLKADQHVWSHNIPMLDMSAFLLVSGRWQR